MDREGRKYRVKKHHIGDRYFYTVQYLSPRFGIFGGVKEWKNYPFDVGNFWFKASIEFISRGGAETALQRVVYHEKYN